MDTFRRYITHKSQIHNLVDIEEIHNTQVSDIISWWTIHLSDIISWWTFRRYTQVYILVDI